VLSVKGDGVIATLRERRNADEGAETALRGDTWHVWRMFGRVGLVAYISMFAVTDGEVGRRHVRVGTRNGAMPHDHVVHLYEDDADLIAAVGAYLIGAIEADEVAVAVTTPHHAQALRAAMSAAGIDVDEACDRGALILLDAEETMARFTFGGWPDAVAFDREIGAVIERAGHRGQRVRAFGEMVALLWDAGHVGAAIELERLWNELSLRLPFSLYCAYAAQAVGDSDLRHELSQVCQLHSEVVGAAEMARTFAALPDSPTAARRFVVDLLHTWGLDDVVEDASLVTAELASNAVIHAQTEFDVAVSARHGTVRISVRDHSSALPLARAVKLAPSMALSGRGLGLIAALAQRWGTELMGDGKIVWVDLSS